MELNREQIVKALEHHANPIVLSCEGCPYMGVSEFDEDNFCTDYLIKDALSLIKELTAENERLIADKKELINKNAELKNKLNEEITEDDIDLYYDKLLQLHIEGIKEAKAYTVRKMQEEIKRRCIEGGIYPAIVKSTIDQIAKEMLNDES